MPEINTGGSDGATNEGAVTKFQEELDAQLGGIATTLGEKLTEVTEKQAEAIGTAFAGVYERLEQAATRAGGASAGVRLHSIKEPPVYRFDGDVKQASLVRDSWNWHHNGDYEARDRLHKFQDQQADLTKFQIGVDGDSPGVSHTVPDIIPPGYRPDLFVTQLMQGRPIVSQLSRGTISDATPFTVPRFVSMNSPGPGGSPGTGQAVNDHVEGVNPATSRLVVDSTVVQPAAISGIFELTREIVDSSNPAIDAIAMQSMRESWNQQTEQRAYTALNGAAPGSQAVDITGADLASDDGEIGKSVRHEILARYPFVRFAAPTGAVMSSGVTAHLARAEDGNGRPLFASVGAQNATGTGNAVAQGWSVDGLALTPAWAVTEEEDDDVLIVLNRQDVWSWESPTLMFRFEEKQGPAIVELALFGYYASHVLRPSGLFSVRLGDGS